MKKVKVISYLLNTEQRLVRQGGFLGGFKSFGRRAKIIGIVKQLLPISLFALFLVSLWLCFNVGGVLRDGDIKIHCIPYINGQISIIII